MITSISFLPTDKRIMCTVSTDGTCCLWDIASSSLLKRFNVPEKDNFISCSDISPGAGILVSGTSNSYIYATSMKTQSILFKTKIFQTDEHIKHLSINKFNPSNVLFNTIGGKCSIVNIETKTNIMEFPDLVSCCAFSPYHNNYFVICTYQGKVISYLNQKMIHSVFVTKEEITNIAFSPHNKELICITTILGSIIIVYLNENADNSVFKIGEVHIGAALCVTFHPLLNNIIVSGGSDKSIAVIDIKKYKTICKCSVHNSAITSLAIPPHMPLLLIITSIDSTLRFLSLDRVLNNYQAINLFKAEFKNEATFIPWLTPLQLISSYFFPIGIFCQCLTWTLMILLLVIFV